MNQLYMQSRMLKLVKQMALYSENEYIITYTDNKRLYNFGKNKFQLKILTVYGA